MRSVGSLTEASNPATVGLDRLPTLDALRKMNAEDARVAMAVADELPRIAQIVDGVSERLLHGGRLFYVGAGTSGRLGVLDASECPPTFNAEPELVQAVIAGGDVALRSSVEDAEDHWERGAADLQARGVRDCDAVVGIAASGATPYTVGAVRWARSLGAFTGGVANNRPCLLEAAAEVCACPLVGPEVIAGSTRMKAGTAQKLVLNMISTLVMVKLGKTYGNLMVDVRPVNAKLIDRACRIIQAATGCDAAVAGRVLTESGMQTKLAVVMAATGLPAAAARDLLARAGGFAAAALGSDPVASHSGM